MAWTGVIRWSATIAMSCAAVFTPRRMMPFSPRLAGRPLQRLRNKVPTNLPTDLLRSLVAIVDSGSMLKATDTIFLTQSALSLQMKRLEELVQQPLFTRRGRRLLLTDAGQCLVERARQMLDINDCIIASLTSEQLAGPVSIGLVQDFAEALLTGVLRRFS